ncbi:Pimeloyl-ACP methyl ester carboxylesterase [Enhydrobacter aerosaccus]|uniref:Pimeloyl-ACP methyl ester carboxylesterase n=1 Tax=Enhydrobacter aerosaccus TaxID=225324 RepID=A0A1T4K6A0_9HYPH|nr:alpha/beta hydrolase [Enhydrobacter aerosaccus]SJZ37857.1 Pimeloyl-ACP methyl ester carboxylesterase [Enhydrobacter aerosaccus]
MPQATTSDGVKLYYEEVGSGTPILFVHEYSGDWRSWEPQMRFFARKYRCITYSFRGYPGSDVPDDGSMYGQQHAVDDARHVLDHLKIDRAHIVGLSQGAFATAHFGRCYPDRALSLTLAGIGSGAGREGHEQFKKDAQATAALIRKRGMAHYAESLKTNPTRSRFKLKDPRGFAEFVKHLAEHPDAGAANTMENYQGKRPSLYDFDAEWKKLALPVLIICGDEDEPCLQPSLYLKHVLPNAGLAMFAKTGHTVNIEEPDAFNREVWNFLTLAEAGKWMPAEPMGAEASRI